MGLALIACAPEFTDTTVTAATDAGDDFAAGLALSDACIDFSHHSALGSVLAACVAARKTLVIGTTGISDDGVALLTLVRWRGRPAEFSLPPGRYQVQAWAGGVCVWTRAIAVDAAPLMLRSEPPPAAIVRLAALPMQPTSDFRVQWQVRGADGVHRSTSARPMDAAPTDAANLAIALPPGDYEVRASSLGGAEVVAQFTVPLPPGRQAPVLRLP